VWVKDQQLRKATELLASWRAAGRDTAAAKAASAVASLALEAAKAADEAAAETQAAASAAPSAVDQALKAAASAKRAAEHAANAARILLASAEGDKVRAKHDLELAEEAEDKTREEFHDSELQGFPKDKG
jgi:type II secretory pathway component HofQ